jgi:hypothetical protein
MIQIQLWSLRMDLNQSTKNSAIIVMKLSIEDMNVQRESKRRIVRMPKEKKKENWYKSVICVVIRVIKNTIVLVTIGIGRKKELTLVQKTKSSSWEVLKT